MIRSMYSGVSGLRAHQTKMDVIGNNIANVNTIGFKAQRVTFNEVFSQTLQAGTAASDETGRGGRNPMQVGLGVNVSSIDMLMTQGSAQRTDNPFDLMIDGDGFIVVGDGSGQYFTRAGALRQDADGNLVIPNGMKVQGWLANEDGSDIVRGQVTDIKLNDAKNASSPPQTTTLAQISGNLNLSDAINDPLMTQIKLYDSLGNLYSANIDIAYDATNQEWSVSFQADPDKAGNILLSDTNGNKFSIAAPTPAAHTIKFDAAGKLETGGTLDLAGFDLTNAELKNDDGTYTAHPINAVIGKNGEVTVDFSELTQYASKTKIDSKSKDGAPAGQMMGFDVGADGKITAYYNNGATKLLGQIVVANFDNPAGLEKAGDNLFRSTASSGAFDSIGEAGTFQTGVLEMSNVDLSKEFTEMIVTQRGFQANSRIISTSDEMLQELVNIKR